MNKPQKTNKLSISRREFLKSMGSGFIGSAVLSSGGFLGKNALAEIMDVPFASVRGSTALQLNVNGQKRTVKAEPRTTLLEVLRDQLNLTGPKPACERGQCGACTVLMEDKTVLACMVLAVDVGSKSIVTVEGLSSGSELTPIQKAFVEHDGLMCGFCTPGFVVAATALLKVNSRPTVEEIKAGLSGNLCRCGAYPKIFQAVGEAARHTNSRGGVK